MESNTLEKFINKSVASKILAQTPSKIRQIVKICDVNCFFPKAILVLPKYFLNFRFYAVVL